MSSSPLEVCNHNKVKTVIIRLLGLWNKWDNFFVHHPELLGQICGHS